MMDRQGWHSGYTEKFADLEQMATLFEAGAIRVTRQDGDLWMQSAEIDAVADDRQAVEAPRVGPETFNGVFLFWVQNTGHASLDGRAK